MAKSPVANLGKIRYSFRILRSLAAPFSLAAISLSLLFGALQTRSTFSLFGYRFENHLVEAAFILVLAAFTLLIIRLVDIVVWQGLQQGLQQQVPKLLQDMVAALIWFGYLCVILIFIFDQPIGPILTASTILLGVIGFTLQRPLLDAFCGVIICFQSPFKEGDWIQVDEKSPIGKIVQIDWRTVHIVTPEQITIVLTNSQIANQAIKVYSRPHTYFRDEIEVTLPYDVTTKQGQRLLLGAANQVAEIAALPMKSIVSISSYTDCGILWRLLYWCPDPGKIPIYRFLVHQNILRNLHYADISVPVPMLDIRSLPKELSVDEEDGIDKLMARIPLFAPLTTEELRHLSKVAISRLVVTGEPLIHQGDVSDSLYILREGLLAVSIKQADGTELIIDHIGPGQFFGEKSFLLGEPRSATVTPVVDSMIFEVTKESMATLIHNRPAIANYLSELLSERQLNRITKLQFEQAQHEEDFHLISAKLLNRIRSIFNLKADSIVKTKDC